MSKPNRGVSMQPDMEWAKSGGSQTHPAKERRNVQMTEDEKRDAELQHQIHAVEKMVGRNRSSEGRWQHQGDRERTHETHNAPSAPRARLRSSPPSTPLIGRGAGRAGAQATRTCRRPSARAASERRRRPRAPAAAKEAETFSLYMPPRGPAVRFPML